MAEEAADVRWSVMSRLILSRSSRLMDGSAALEGGSANE